MYNIVNNPYDLCSTQKDLVREILDNKGNHFFISENHNKILTTEDITITGFTVCKSSISNIIVSFIYKDTDEESPAFMYREDAEQMLNNLSISNLPPIIIEQGYCTARDDKTVLRSVSIAYDEHKNLVVTVVTPKGVFSAPFIETTTNREIILTIPENH